MKNKSFILEQERDSEEIFFRAKIAVELRNELKHELPSPFPCRQLC